MSNNEYKFMGQYDSDWETCLFCGFEACECNDTQVYETKQKWRDEIVELNKKIKELQEAIKTIEVPPIPVFWGWKISTDTRCPDCGHKMSTYDGCCKKGESYLKYQYTKRFYPNAVETLKKEIDNGKESNEETRTETEASVPVMHKSPKRIKQVKV